MLVALTPPLDRWGWWFIELGSIRDEASSAWHDYPFCCLTVTPEGALFIITFVIVPTTSVLEEVSPVITISCSITYQGHTGWFVSRQKADTYSDIIRISWGPLMVRGNDMMSPLFVCFSSLNILVDSGRLYFPKDCFELLLYCDWWTQGLEK